mgnify:CR=1 FL=1
MAFLGSIGKALGIKNLNKGDGWNIARVVFPPIIATEVAVAALGKAVDLVAGPPASDKRNVLAPGSNYNIYGGGYEGMYVQQPYGAPPAYSVYFSEPTGASTPWDYSTSSIPFSIPLAGAGFSEGLSMNSEARSWEDWLAVNLNR